MTFGEQQDERGYHLVYRRGEGQRCPGCGRSNWYVGRLSAECAFCGTALDLPESTRGGGLFRGRTPERFTA